MLIYKILNHCTVKERNKKLSSWLIAIIMDKTFRQIHFPTFLSGSLKTETSLMTGTDKSSWCLSFFSHWPKMNYKNPPSRAVTCRILTVWIIVYGRLTGNTWTGTWNHASAEEIPSALQLFTPKVIHICST